jgi:hypothetical protein
MLDVQKAARFPSAAHPLYTAPHAPLCCHHTRCHHTHRTKVVSATPTPPLSAATLWGLRCAASSHRIHTSHTLANEASDLRQRWRSAVHAAEVRRACCGREPRRGRPRSGCRARYAGSKKVGPSVVLILADVRRLELVVSILRIVHLREEKPSLQHRSWHQSRR